MSDSTEPTGPRWWELSGTLRRPPVADDPGAERRLDEVLAAGVRQADAAYGPGWRRTEDTGRMTVLDTIDNTLRDYSTSGDAMRWTPDAPNVKPLGEVRTVDVLMQVDVRPIVAAFEARIRAIAGIGAALSAAGGPFGPKRSERATRIRRAYGQRHGRR